MTKALLKIGVLFIVLINGCGIEERNVIPGEFKTISIDVEKSLDFYLSDFVTEISYIPLETNQQSVISAVDKIYTYKDEFYILDKKQDAVFIFSKQGKYKRKIEKQGKGPGEYVEITDFSIDIKTGTILILDRITNSFHLYTSNGKPIKSIKANNTIYFCELYGDKIMGYSDNFLYTEKYNLHIYDINKHTSEDFLPINEKLKDFQSGTGAQFILNHSNQLLFKEALSYNIYKLDSTGFKRYYFIDFGNYSLPDNYFNMNNLSLYKLLFNLNDGTYAVYPTIFYENSDIIYFSYKYKNYNHVVYDKRTKNLLHGNVRDDINSLFFVSPLYSNGSAFYATIEPIKILNYIKYLKSDNKQSDILENITSKKSNEVLFNLEVDNNPVIIKYMLK